MYERSVVSNEGQNAIKTTRLENSAGFSSADQFQDFDALFGQVFARTGRHVCDDQSIAHRFDSAVDGNDTSRAFGGHIQVVSDSSGGHFQHVIGCALVQKYTTQRRQKSTGRTTI